MGTVLQSARLSCLLILVALLVGVVPTSTSGASEPMLVERVDLIFYEVAPNLKLAIGIVRVVDAAMNPVAGATVEVGWSPPSGMPVNQSKLTNANGLAFPVILGNRTGAYQLCVDNVAKAGYTYEPNLNLETCLNPELVPASLFAELEWGQIMVQPALILNRTSEELCLVGVVEPLGTLEVPGCCQCLDTEPEPDEKWCWPGTTKLDEAACWADPLCKWHSNQLCNKDRGQCYDPVRNVPCSEADEPSAGIEQVDWFYFEPQQFIIPPMQSVQFDAVFDGATVNGPIYLYARIIFSNCFGRQPESRLAAYVLLHSLPDAQGYLQGQVLAADTGEPLYSAEVRVYPTGIVENTQVEGDYQHILSPGVYYVRASARGYVPKVVPGVEVVTDAVTIQDFMLEPAE